MNLLEILTAQRKGRCLIEAQQTLQGVVKAALAAGKKGTLTIKLTINPGADGTVIVSDDVIPVEPRPNRSSTTFYADENGALHREDPNQPDLPILNMNQAASQ